MDIVGTVSMMLDIIVFFGSSNMEAKQADTTDMYVHVMFLRTTRAAKVGARAGRLTRVVRMLRLFAFYGDWFPGW